MFQGAITALVTPFNEAGAPDLEALAKFVEWQISQGIQGVVPCGSTGEAITLTPDECKSVIETTVKAANKRVPVIAGTGSSSTANAINATIAAKELGADAALINTPAYNKPQQEGLYQHFAAVAEATPGFPIVLYNVPGRTAITLENTTMARLVKNYPKSFVAYKDATADLQMTDGSVQIDGLTVLSGDDCLGLPMISIGAQGIVSVISNIAPKLVVVLSNAARAGDYETARPLAHKAVALSQACFCESNPVPVKYGASKLGHMNERVRLPLAPASDAAKAAMDTIMQEYGLL
ncbi:4-hydroxy-tetrahydrodipicolinate synthase [Planctomycetota bacterium]|nr:4-hydroxy-tetrahydrodipicolinate synthase [Planctomycetota bacterium]